MLFREAVLLKQSQSLEEAEAELRRQLVSETSHHIVQVRRPHQAPLALQKLSRPHDACGKFTFDGDTGTGRLHPVHSVSCPCTDLHARLLDCLPTQPHSAPARPVHSR